MIKPNDDYGGHGLYLGARLSESEWDETIATALRGDFVVQEAVDLHPEQFPVFSENEWSLQPMFVDINPFLFRGEVCGAMVRLSHSPVVNVTSGGGEAGFFVFEPGDATEDPRVCFTRLRGARQLTSTKTRRRCDDETKRMSSEIEKRIELEVVYVLFLDIVGYSKRATNEQRVLIDQLNQAVRNSDEFQRAEAAARIIKIPTGDGMALVFYKSPEQPVECALEISRVLKSFPELQVRMGVHSGPISAVTDLNDRTNAAGIGINIAQRVMDCGDAGHILVSKRVAEDLEEYGNWQPQLHDLGEFEVKHGVHVHVFNLFTDELGNPEVPEKLRRTNEQKAPAVSRRGEELWVAVLPFRGAGDAEMESFADGLVEDITTGLSRFRYLSVVASASAARLKGEAGDERALGAKLGARYVLEGSIRKGGSGIRVSAQLVDTRTGEQLWAETYNRDLQSIDYFCGAGRRRRPHRCNGR